MKIQTFKNLNICKSGECVSEVESIGKMMMNLIKNQILTTNLCPTCDLWLWV